MATYTTFEREALERYLIMFDLGDLADYEPISDGIENSNYFVRFEDSEQEYVLTITEDLDFSDVAFFNDLLQILAKRGVPVPEPQRTLDGMSSTTFRRKPTWLFNRLPGAHAMNPTTEHCVQIGTALAKLHEGSARAKYQRQNAYHRDWCSESFAQLASKLDEDDRSALSQSIAEYQTHEHQYEALPQGIIHGDLFRDNALFDNGVLTGVIDFYHACNDFLVQDIAIAINDWCPLAGPSQEALLKGYESVRLLTPGEVSALPKFRTFAAMRFSLTRLLGGRSDNPVKNPREFLDLLAKLQDAAY